MAKIKYGISNVHIALWEEGSGGTWGWGTPIAVPGARALTLDPTGELIKWFADNIPYYKAHSNQGYEGSLELAMIPDTLREAILGEVLDSTTKNLYEISDGSEAVTFALGFQVETDEDPISFWFYNVSADRASLTANTKEDTIDPQTDTIPLTLAPDTDGYVRVKSTENSTTASWFAAVVTHPAA